MTIAKLYKLQQIYQKESQKSALWSLIIQNNVGIRHRVHYYPTYPDQIIAVGSPLHQCHFHQLLLSPGIIGVGLGRYFIHCFVE